MAVRFLRRVPNSYYFIDCLDYFLLRDRITGRERGNDKHARCQRKPRCWWVLIDCYGPPA